MDFQLDEAQEAMREVARSFAAAWIAPHAAQWWEDEVFPSHVFKAMGELGLMGVLVPERYGGADAGSRICRGDGADRRCGSVRGGGWNAHITIASLPLLAFGTEEQKQRWLRPLAEGRFIGAFGLTEPEASFRRRRHPHPCAA